MDEQQRTAANGPGISMSHENKFVAIVARNDLSRERSETSIAGLSR